jgi:hypothetical protein
MLTRGTFAVLCTIAAAGVRPAVAEGSSPLARAANGQLKVVTLPTPAGPKNLPGLSSGLLQAARATAAQRAAAVAAPAPAAPATSGLAAPLTPADPAVSPDPVILDDAGGRGGAFGSGLGLSRGALGCGARNTDGNVRVNQDCGFRGQAEEIIKFNPADPDNLIAGMNDSRIGFNHCGFAWSTDAGRSWGDGTPPFWLRLNFNPPDHTVAGGPPSFHTYDFASDPNVGADSAGRTFFGCIVADIFDAANGLLVTEGPSFAKGSFYNTVPTPPFSPPATANRFVVVEDNNGAILHDKPFLTVDFHPQSSFRDSVYVTWTVFNFACGKTGDQYCSSKIFFSRSRDHAQTWSKPVPISGVSTLCQFGNFFDPTEPPNACNFDQGSDPIVRPNGDIVVVFNNGNTPSTVNQQLAVVSKDGGDTWSPPVFVGEDDETGAPLCDFGRGPEECIPGAFIRTNDFPRIAVNRDNGNLYAAWQDYRTGEFDIHLSASFDGGFKWREAAAPVNPDSRRDHYFPAIDVVAGRGSDDGERRADQVGVSYFRSDRVPGENARPVFAVGEPGVGASDSDYDLSGGRSLATPYAARRISPRFPAPDKDAGFNGDYSGLSLVGKIAHPIWSDTRNAIPNTSPTLHDEDIFTDAVTLPDGHGESGD